MKHTGLTAFSMGVALALAGCVDSGSNIPRSGGAGPGGGGATDSETATGIPAASLSSTEDAKALSSAVLSAMGYSTGASGASARSHQIKLSSAKHATSARQAPRPADGELDPEWESEKEEVTEVCDTGSGVTTRAGDGTPYYFGHSEFTDCARPIIYTDGVIVVEEYFYEDPYYDEGFLLAEDYVVASNDPQTDGVEWAQLSIDGEFHSITELEEEQYRQDENNVSTTYYHERKEGSAVTTMFGESQDGVHVSLYDTSNGTEKTWFNGYSGLTNENLDDCLTGSFHVSQEEPTLYADDKIVDIGRIVLTSGNDTLVIESDENGDAVAYHNGQQIDQIPPTQDDCRIKSLNEDLS